ncbi:hypothetical protein SAMN04244579_04188 [Azotobacter beijerinckii]|uniref:Uncharacterized protein n=1 Tax=Azotobacter beijerinckii TaxID=170623 RepID=A0A1H6YDL6_9GAMM|nr:hypothetical protein SAMN04244579_04188 [Azotobacter beijerinckii]
MEIGADRNSPMGYGIRPRDTAANSGARQGERRPPSFWRIPKRIPKTGICMEITGDNQKQRIGLEVPYLLASVDNWSQL